MSRCPNHVEEDAADCPWCDTSECAWCRAIADGSQFCSEECRDAYEQEWGAASSTDARTTSSPRLPMRVGDRVKLIGEPVRWSQAYSVVGREGRVTLLCESGFILVELDRESREEALLRVKVEERALVKLEPQRALFIEPTSAPRAGGDPS